MMTQPPQVASDDCSKLAGLHAERCFIQHSHECTCSLSAVPGSLVSADGTVDVWADGQKVYTDVLVRAGLCQIMVYHTCLDTSGGARHVGAATGEVFAGLKFQGENTSGWCSSTLSQSWQKVRFFPSVDYPAVSTFASAMGQTQDRGGWSCGDAGRIQCHGTGAANCSFHFGSDTLHQDSGSVYYIVHGDEASTSSHLLVSIHPPQSSLCLTDVGLRQHDAPCLVASGGQVRLGTKDALLKRLSDVEDSKPAEGSSGSFFINLLKYIGLLSLVFGCLCCYSFASTAMKIYAQAIPRPSGPPPE
jgi:hypothetical protein